MTTHDEELLAERFKAHRSPAAARQLASRVRRRVQGSATVPDPERIRQLDLVVLQD